MYGTKQKKCQGLVQLGNSGSIQNAIVIMDSQTNGQHNTRPVHNPHTGNVMSHTRFVKYVSVVILR